VTYQELVEILKLSQDRVARDERYETFKRAILFHGVDPRCEGAVAAGDGVILIGGTNGKGTTAATLAELLRGGGRSGSRSGGGSVGLFTSPHLMEPTERIAIDGLAISQDEMVAAYLAVERAVGQFDLSHFEILTLMMIEVFFGGRVRPRVSRAVIEVGVGGRLDPTRAIPHATAVLARIAMDHEAILGSTIEAIAREKLAIAEGAVRLVHLPFDASLSAVFADARARFRECQFVKAREFPSEVVVLDGVPRWTMTTPWGRAELSLFGARAVVNMSLALEVMSELGEPVDVSRLSRVVWPGRMERIAFRGRDVYLSGDHNEQGVESLREILAHFAYERVWIVVGIGRGKPAGLMLAQYELIPRASLILTRTYFRALDDAAFHALPGSLKIDDAFEALESAVARAGPRDLVVVSGSLYLVGDLRARMLRE
jgi:dihydrofolate synthase/folylpolyglutamate synthase